MNSQSIFIEDSKKRIKTLLRELDQLNPEDPRLYLKANQSSWSADDCFKHLVVMWRLYQRSIVVQVNRSERNENDTFRMSFFAKWFSHRMKPGNYKIKTYKIFEPKNYSSETNALEELKSAQTEMLDILERCKNIDMNKTKISSPLTKLVRFSLVEAFDVLLNHQDRHWQQAQRAINE